MKTVSLPIFEEKDFSGSGQYLVNNLTLHIQDDGYLSTVLYKVGYISGLKDHPDDETYNQKWCIISMSDGLIMFHCHLFPSKLDLITYLNKENSSSFSGVGRNGWRMATNSELTRTAAYQKHRTQ